MLERAEAAGPPPTTILTCSDGVRPTLDALREYLKSPRDLHELGSIRIELMNAVVHCEARMLIAYRGLKKDPDWMRNDTEEDRAAIRGETLEKTSYYCASTAAILRAHLRERGMKPDDVFGDDFGDVFFRFKKSRAQVHIHAMEVQWPALLTSCMHIGPEGQVVRNDFANVDDLVEFLHNLGVSHDRV